MRGMRARSLMQVYRTLLASVEYARLPEGLDYDEVRRCLYFTERRAAPQVAGTPPLHNVGASQSCGDI